MAYKTKGSKLIFIGRIERDGSKITPCEGDYSHLDDTDFYVNGLSLTLGNYIACDMNCYIVKFKTKNT